MTTRHPEFIAPPMKRAHLRRLAQAVRGNVSFGDVPKFDIVRFVEFTLPEWDPSYTFAVSDENVMGQNHALTHPATRTIEVRSDIYDRACEGRGRDRMTLAHEVAHLIIHDEVTLARRMDTAPVPAYRDPEWQAKAFAGELMIPIEVCRTLKGNPEDVASIFGVSPSALSTQLAAWKREGLIS